MENDEYDRRGCQWFLDISVKDMGDYNRLLLSAREFVIKMQDEHPDAVRHIDTLRSEDEDTGTSFVVFSIGKEAYSVDLGRMDGKNEDAGIIVSTKGCEVRFSECSEAVSYMESELSGLLKDSLLLRKQLRERMKRTRIDASSMEIVSQMGDGLCCNVWIRTEDDERPDFDEGVTACYGEDGSVVELHFRGYGIRTLPESVTKLSKIRCLTFNWTRVSELPEWIKDLAALEYLGFAGTPAHKLPQWMKDVPSLKMIDMRGSGAKYCGDFEYKTYFAGEATIMRYVGSDENVTVPAVVDGFPVTDNSAHFPDSTFGGCGALKSVTFSEGIRTVRLSFSDCKLLETINIPASVTKIHLNSISRCPSLARINVHIDNPNYADVDGILYSKDKTELVYAPERHATASAEST